MFSKPCTTLEQQINQLKNRGLEIVDEDKARHFLSNVSYYRLSGYWWPMQSDKISHMFKPDSSFDNVIELYNFDRELRLLLFDIIEKIEIALRTKMIQHLSIEYGAWWFQEVKLFINTREHIRTLSSLDEELVRSKDQFIKDHLSKHKDDLRFPPAWKTLEIMTIGSLSRLYGNLRNDIKSKDRIATEFNTVNHTYLPSWLQAITQIRNICAHHGRLWNRNLPAKPKLLSNPPGKWLQNIPSDSNKIYLHLCCMKYLLDAISPGHNFKEKLFLLLQKYEKNIDHRATGFFENWENEDLWK